MCVVSKKIMIDFLLVGEEIVVNVWCGNGVKIFYRVCLSGFCYIGYYVMIEFEVVFKSFLVIGVYVIVLCCSLLDESCVFVGW